VVAGPIQINPRPIGTSTILNELKITGISGHRNSAGSRKIKIETSIIAVLQVIMLCLTVSAENIDPDNDGSQFAYGENVGWLNFEPNRPEPNVGTTVSDNQLTGFVWAKNIGWINLDPNDSDPNSGIKNDGSGFLSGFAWGENVGWLNFNPQVPNDANQYGVIIDSEGNFDGWAWGENIGWIHFQSAFVLDWDDLASFAAQWLETGNELGADLYIDGKVNLLDYSILMNNWLDECPVDWGICPPGYKVKTAWTGR